MPQSSLFGIGTQVLSICLCENTIFIIWQVYVSGLRNASMEVVFNQSGQKWQWSSMSGQPWQGFLMSCLEWQSFFNWGRLT